MIGGSSSTPGDIPGSRVRSAQDALLQAIELAVAAEEVGIDGAYFRVHHFAEQQTSPFPLLAAIAARTSGIEIGTGVIAGYRGGLGSRWPLSHSAGVCIPKHRSADR
jgi:alkanesulfonate monooxygenase SsuD/methylene tetrahydromethanopterin reductase-like flavin-dependent oxidoreductase (luciferase family)